MAIKGKLVPQNPDDEPASVLLERIRAEKQQLIKEGKIKKDKNDSIIYKGDDNRYYEKVGSEVKDITGDLPFEIPNSWVWTRFSALIQIISGVSYDKKDVATKGIRILRGGNINDLKVSLFSDDVFLPETYYDPDKQVQISDVLIVASTGSKEVIGKAGYVIEPLVNTQIGAFLRIVRPILKWYAPYVKLIFATEYYREHIRHLSGGTNINNIKADYINAFLISLPPYAEQIRIAERINSLFEQIDIIEQNQTDIDTLYDEFRKRTLTLAIQGKLVPQDPNDEPASVLLERIRAKKKAKLGKRYVDSYIYKGDDNCYYEKVGINEPVRLDNLPFDIPDSWCWARLKDITFNHGQKVPNVNFSYIDIGSVDNVHQRLSKDENIISPEKAPSRARKIVKTGDILYATVRPYLHNMCIVNKAFSCESIASTGFAVIATEQCIQNAFLFYYMLSPIFDQYANSSENAKGVAYPAINDDKLYKAFIPIPPIKEQGRIADVIKILLKTIKDEG